MKKNTIQKKLKITLTYRGDIRCDCCLRHVNDIEPFGGPGDPLVGDFTGYPLIKQWRYDFPEVKNPYDISDCETDNGELDEKKFIQKYGKEALRNYAILPDEEKSNDISDCETDNGELDEQKFIQKYGKKALEHYAVTEGYNIISSYWLCRDCILLDRAQFYKKKRESFKKRYDK